MPLGCFVVWVVCTIEASRGETQTPHQHKQLGRQMHPIKDFRDDFEQQSRLINQARAAREALSAIGTPRYNRMIGKYTLSLREGVGTLASTFNDPTIPDDLDTITIEQLENAAKSLAKAATDRLLKLQAEYQELRGAVSSLAEWYALSGEQRGKIRALNEEFNNLYEARIKALQPIWRAGWLFHFAPLGSSEE